MVPFYRQFKFWMGLVMAVAGFGEFYFGWSTDTVAQVVAGAGMVLGLLLKGNALLSDQVSAAPSVATPPPARPPVGLLLVLALLLSPIAAPAQLLDNGTATAVPVASGLLDLEKLSPGDHGRQREVGVGAFDVVGAVPIYVVKERASGRLYYTDPVELAQKRFAAHRYLIALAPLGWPTSKWHAKERATEMVEAQLRQVLADTAVRLTAQIPALIGRGNDLIAATLQGLAMVR